jgi:hypothetical protein
MEIGSARHLMAMYVYFQVISGNRKKQRKLQREARCNVTFTVVYVHPMASSAVFCLSLQIREYIHRFALQSTSVALLDHNLTTC